MYPLVEPALESLSEQIYKKQSLENITYSEENQYTSMVLINAIEDALDKAEVKSSGSKKNPTEIVHTTDHPWGICAFEK